jgi:hypothetical protein
MRRAGHSACEAEHVSARCADRPSVSAIHRLSSMNVHTASAQLIFAAHAAERELASHGVYEGVRHRRNPIITELAGGKPALEKLYCRLRLPLPARAEQTARFLSTVK